MKGIVVTSTTGITGEGKAKTGLTLICFNKRKKREDSQNWRGRNRWDVEETVHRRRILTSGKYHSALSSKGKIHN